MKKKNLAVTTRRKITENSRKRKKTEKKRKFKAK